MRSGARLSLCVFLAAPIAIVHPDKDDRIAAPLHSERCEKSAHGPSPLKRRLLPHKPIEKWEMPLGDEERCAAHLLKILGMHPRLKTKRDIGERDLLERRLFVDSRAKMGRKREFAQRRPYRENQRPVLQPR